MEDFVVWKEEKQHPANPTLTPGAGECGATFSCKCVLKVNVQAQNFQSCGWAVSMVLKIPSPDPA